ncbi:hypothetical protein TpMuguga_02g00294 [Theileria parva strain Muguga]|uniref:Uncharacterized protein n=1 Tax=Theileria parva TaxID=5875 RepID=Q4N5J6_THEPA|nr:uncharacterized protein TpMuguga_02g00294 [Theileria parva strain Muguga]EAN32577.1 hypothetical protein TpMuguga_02g00294 [Theileria parva strain Muguga]|eukprot:XP_764860.1 hypothetical protein [Theileria parva strain Muguga]
MTSSDLYNRKVSGKIKLKGISKLYKKKKKESSEVDDSKNENSENKKVNEFIGTGRIVSSSNTVQGFETKFVEEASVNDRIIIEHPLTHGTEERVITCILSNRTLSIDEPFSVDLITTIPYNIRKEDVQTDKDGVKVETLRDKNKTTTISVREKSGMWSYRNVTKTVKGNLTQEDRLDERVKLGRDKYCW